MTEALREILEDLEQGRVTPAEALRRIELARDGSGEDLVTLAYDDPVVRDHRGRTPLVDQPESRIVLGVTHCSLALAAGTAFPAGFRSLTIAEPTVLRPGEAVDLRLTAEPGRAFAIRARRSDGSERVVASGRHLADADPPQPGRLDLAQLRGGLPERDVADAYHRPESERGPSLRALTRLWAGRDEALAELVLSDGSGVAEPFPAALLDGAFVAAMELVRSGDSPVDGVWIPFAVAEAVAATALPTRSLCHVVRARSTADTQIFDLYFCAPDGTVALAIRGFTCRFAPYRKTDSADRLEALLNREIASVAGRDDIGVDENFMASGLSSLQMLALTEKIGAQLGIDLYPTIMFEYQTVRELIDFILAEHGTELPAR